MTLDELSARLSELEDARLIAWRELAKLRGVQEEIEALEHDASALLESYEHATPEDLDALSLEERHHVYRMMRLEVLARPDGSLEARGDVPLDISNLNSTATRRASSTSARWDRHDLVLAGFEARFETGSRHYPSRYPGLREHSDSPLRGGDRPPRLEHAAHFGRHGDHQPYDQHLPAARAVPGESHARGYVEGHYRAAPNADYGMQTFDQALLKLVEENRVTYEEALQWRAARRTLG
jgi:hypothetical protein